MFLRTFLILALLLCFSSAKAQPLTGWSLSPEGFPISFNNIFQFLGETDSLCPGSVVYGSASWRDSLGGSGQQPGAQTFVCQQQTVYGYTEMVTFGWATYGAGIYYLNSPANVSVNNWTNAQMRTEFLQMLVTFADTWHPRFLFVGNEVDFYYSLQPADYANWSSFYSQAYDSVKAHSPNTMMGTVISCEHICGNTPANGWNTPLWNALNMMDTSRIDLLGVTTYPFLNTNSAAAIPLNYYDSLFVHWPSKPLAVVETGWPADALAPFSWNCSEQEQVNFINRFFSLMNGHPLQAVNWLFLHYSQDHDSVEEKIFCSISMFDSLGVPRQLTLNQWSNHCPGITGQSEVQTREKISAAPNPFSEQVILSLPQNALNCKAEIFDASGRLVYSISAVNEQKLTISRNNFPAGIYWLRFSSNQFSETVKLCIISE